MCLLKDLVSPASSVDSMIVVKIVEQASWVELERPWHISGEGILIFPSGGDLCGFAAIDEASGL